jgi:hypothetical protein
MTSVYIRSDLPTHLEVNTNESYMNVIGEQQPVLRYVIFVASRLFPLAYAKEGGLSNFGLWPVQEPLWEIIADDSRRFETCDKAAGQDG